MEKSLFSPAWAAVRHVLVGMRTAADLTQRQLAKRLGRERSFVARLESGERRIDVVEFCWFCEACGIKPQPMFALIARAARQTRGLKITRIKTARVLAR